MSRSRAIAFLTAVAATLAMTFGLTAFGASAAQAAPGAYPPPPPSLVVNKGVVKIGIKVRATGKKYIAREKIAVVIKFLPKGSTKWKTTKVVGLKADKFGKFTYNVKTKSAGTIVITAKGAKSKKGASATILVLKKGKGRIVMRKASFDSAPATVAVGSTTEAPASNGVWIAIAGLGVLALAGSAAVTRNHVRRRNNV
ncbi:hypothetical protein [Actinoplanes sp. NPDC051494]|uniref:hypothetical protein n=1 Tax=Actinoplanes sp. NPDC051494 TaxID=3363907 RepID=UPI0037BD0F0A